MMKMKHSIHPIPFNQKNASIPKLFFISAVTLVLTNCSSTSPIEASRQISSENLSYQAIPEDYSLPNEILDPSKIKCETVRSIHQSKRDDCVYQTQSGKRTMHVLTLSGENFVQLSKIHGQFMAKEIEEGSLVEAI